MRQTIPVAWKTTPFLGDPRRMVVEEGASLADIVRLAEVPPWFAERGVVCINGEPVPMPLWARVRPRPSRSEVIVTLHVRMHGDLGGDGGGLLLTIATIAVLAVGTLITGGLLGPAALGILGASFGLGGLGAVLLGTAVGIGGALAVSALSPPPALAAPTGATAAQAASKQGRAAGSAALQGNVLNPGGPVAMAVGTHRVFPSLATEPLFEIVGDDEYVEAVYVLAGPHQLTDIRLGTTPIDDIAEVQYETRQGLAGEPQLAVVTRQSRTEPATVNVSQFKIDEDTPTSLLDQSDPDSNLPQWHRLTTRVDPDEVWFTFVWPSGHFDQSDFTRKMVTPMRIRIRPRGSSTWQNLPELHFQSRSTAPFRKMVKLKWATAPTITPTPASNEAPVYAYKVVPGQDGATVSPATAGWTADAHFSAGAGNNLLSAATIATSNVRNVHMYVDRVEVYLDPATTDQYEVEFVFGMMFSQTSFTAATYAYTGGLIYDFFSYFFDLVFRVRDDLSDRNYQIAMQRFSSVWNEEVLPLQEDAVIAIRAHNRQLEQLSVIASNYVYDYDGSTGEWSDLTTTSNPAPQFRAALSSSLLADPLPPSLIDDANLVEWRAQCVARGLEVNAIVEGRSIADVITMIAGAGYARPRHSETWGAMMDRDRSGEAPSQMFSFRNLRSFRWEKAFADLPDGLRVRWNDQATDYEENEIIVFDPASATLGRRLEDIKYDGLVTEAEAEARALFDLKQARQRATFYHGEADVENIVVQRGDLAVVQHDTLGRRAGSALIKEVTRVGDDVTAILLDGTVPNAAAFINRTGFLHTTPGFIRTGRLGAAIRLSGGEIITRKATAAGAHVTALALDPPIEDSANQVEVGQMVTVGKLWSEHKRVVVASIRPTASLEATITFVDEANELFDFIADGVTLDGTNDYLRRGAELTGIADGKKGTVALAFRVAGGSGDTRRMICTNESASAKFSIFLSVSDQIVIRGRNAAGAIILDLVTTATFTDGLWHHMVASWDLAAAAGQVVVDGALASLGISTATNDVLDYTTGDFFVGANSAGGEKWNGDLAQVFFDALYRQDLSDPGELAEFTDGDPVFMGHGGQLPFGDRPCIFLSGGASSFRRNRGAGGDFTVVGALAEAETSPND